MLDKLKEKAIDKVIDFLSTPSHGEEIEKIINGLKFHALKSMLPVLKPICKLFGLQIKKEFLNDPQIYS